MKSNELPTGELARDVASRRQGVELRRPLSFAGRVRLLLHEIPAPPTMD